LVERKRALLLGRDRRVRQKHRTAGGRL